MIPLFDIEQGSEAWFLAKSGRPSVGSFDRIIITKGEPSKTRTDYLFELVSQRIIGPYADSYTNPHMLRGLEMEPEGRALFELLTGFEVKQVGLVYKDESQRVLWSPDGLLPSAGFEQKNPLPKTHAKYLYGGKLPTEYFQQIQGSMWVCGFDSWWFMSAYPGMPPLLIQVKRDDKWIARLEILMAEFLDELDHVHAAIMKKSA